MSWLDGTSTTRTQSEIESMTARRDLVFARSGIIIASVGAARYRFNDAAIISAVSAVVGTGPTGAALIVDVNLNGTTIFTTQANRPSIAAAAFSAVSGTPNVTSVVIGDILTVDVDQVGSTIQGADLTIQVFYKLT